MRTATATGEVVATWRQVTARARRLAAVLDRLEVPRGGRVGTFAWNSQRHVELYLAVPVSGRVLHTVNHRLFAEEISYIVNDAADDVLFVDRSLLATVWPLVDGFPTVRRVVVMDDGDPREIPDDSRTLDYEELLSGVPESAALVLNDENEENDENEAASLCYTSGTTGRPKGVLYSHRSIVLHALMLLGADNLAISERDVVMPIVPMFHVNAWGLPYAAMLAGSDLVLPGPAMAPEALIGQLERHRVTFSSGVATIWRSLAPLLAAADLSHLRTVASGGGAVPDALSALWERDAGIVLTNGWGMTETSPVHEAAVIAVPDDRWGERPLACVVPVRGRTVDERGLRAHLTGRVASWWIPERVWVIDEIPKTSTGKFAKAVLRERAVARETAG
ncbi:MAG: AMP-binding protein [Trebonia sp.]